MEVVRAPFKSSCQETSQTLQKLPPLRSDAVFPPLVNLFAAPNKAKPSSSKSALRMFTRSSLSDMLSPISIPCQLSASLRSTSVLRPISVAAQSLSLLLCASETTWLTPRISSSRKEVSSTSTLQSSQLVIAKVLVKCSKFPHFYPPQTSPSAA